MTTMAEIKAAAIGLSIREREEVAEFLYDSMSDHTSQSEIDQELSEELNIRKSDREAGRSIPRILEDVAGNIRERFDRP